MFTPGTSGHFLATFLLPGTPDLNSSFRIDHGQRLPSAIATVGGQYHMVNQPECIDQIQKLLDDDRYEYVITHNTAISYFLDQQLDNVWIRKIHPVTGIFGCLKNIYFKKHLIESIIELDTAFNKRIDQLFLNLSDIYQHIVSDNDLPKQYVINFPDLYNIDYLVQLYQQINGMDPNLEKIKFAKDYISKQFNPPLNDCNLLEMDAIIQYVKPTTDFDIALCILIYEKNHRTLDQNRKWSIEQMPDNVDEAVNFLRNIQKQYFIFD